MTPLLSREGRTGGRHRRYLSHTEISKALDCFAAWDFAYGGHLTDGHVLKPKIQHIRLREGRAWGRAVAALHAVERETSAQTMLPMVDGAAPPGGSPPADAGAARLVRPSGRLPLDSPLLRPYARGLTALHEALEEDAVRQRKHGVHDPDAHHEAFIRLAAVLWHYAETTDPIALTDPEVELRVPIPSRSGRGVSNRYAFHAFLDGLTREDGRLWIVEYKLRDRLTDYQQVALGRQYRRYAWAAERALGEQIAGIIVDERLNEAPKPARWVKGRKKAEGMVPSHAKDQLTTGDLYREACLQARVEAEPETFRALEMRRWQARHRVIFTRRELDDAGRELVSAARVIAQLDSGVLWPVRNPAPWRCSGCAFREVCNATDDTELIDLDFERKLPKRLRPVEGVAA